MPYKDPAKKAAKQKEYEENRKKKEGARVRCWMLIFYPDSAPKVWPDMVSDVHLPVWVSPLHNADKWTEADEKENPKHKAGTKKKDHWHLVAQYPDKVSREQFLADFGFLNGPENVKQVKSRISMVRYLVHADDPDKAQYDKADVRTFGGAEIDLVEQLGTHERHEALKAMRAFIRKNNIVDFCDFVDYCDECEITWAHLLDDNSSYVIEKYIKSRRYKLREEMDARSRLGKPYPNPVPRE